MSPIHPLPAQRMPLTVLSAVDAVLRDALSCDLLLDAPDAAVIRYDTVLDADGDSRLEVLVMTAEGVTAHEVVELEHECISCAMRIDALPRIERLAETGDCAGVVLALPIAADPQAVAGSLAPELRRARIASTVALVDADAALHDLLGDDTLAERGLCWTSGDERSVGEALAAQIEYSDVIVAAGEAGTAGAELVEHLRAHDQLLVHGVHAVTVPLLLDGVRHDGAAAARRVDPQCAEPWGGPDDHGTWTLDIASERPFHPGRLLENIELIGAGRMRGKGCFWLPTRPHSVCQWDGVGGQVSIGVVAEAGAELPRTRLVITGVDAADRGRVRRAIEASLLTDREWAAGLLPWLGRDDGMSPWLGEQAAAS